MFSIIYGIILPIDFHIFQDGYWLHYQPDDFVHSTDVVWLVVYPHLIGFTRAISVSLWWNPKRSRRIFFLGPRLLVELGRFKVETHLFLGGEVSCFSRSPVRFPEKNPKIRIRWHWPTKPDDGEDWQKHLKMAEEMRLETFSHLPTSMAQNSKPFKFIGTKKCGREKGTKLREPFVVPWAPFYVWSSIQ
jgi:hypothetical protein